MAIAALSEPLPSLLFTGGRIRTFNEDNPQAAALGLVDGRIVAVGDLATVRDVVGPNACELDLAGGLLVPGLRDAHVHPLWGGLDQLSCDLTSVPADARAYLDLVAG